MERDRGVWCVDVASACQLMGRGRTMVWHYMKQRKLGWHRYGSHTLIFLEDIADMLGQDEDALIDRLSALGLPLWRCWKETMI